MKKTILATMTVAAAILVSAPFAKANATLTLISGATTSITVAGDNPSIDLIGVTVGSWTVNSPIETSSSGPLNLSLTSTDLGSAVNAPLTIIYTSSGPSLTGGHWSYSSSGTFTIKPAVGTLSIANTLYDGVLNPLNLFETQDFSGLVGTTQSYNGPTDVGYLASMNLFTELIVITPVFADGVKSGNIKVNLTDQFTIIPVPDGGLTIAMLGTVLLGVAGIRSRFGKRA